MKTYWLICYERTTRGADGLELKSLVNAVIDVSPVKWLYETNATHPNEHRVLVNWAKVTDGPLTRNKLKDSLD